MIKFLLCLIFGHKNVVKAFTGQTKESETPFGGVQTTHYYTWKKLDFCLRCGKTVKDFIDVDNEKRS
jgi:hypothetical protein